MPRLRASVHTAEKPTWSPDTPPHAVPKSPVSRSLSSGVLGEWSLTTQSISPSASARHSRSRLAESRMGGQHLYWVAPAGTPSASRVR